MVGIDAAEPLIAAARKRNAGDGLAIRYEIGDATKLRDVGGQFAAGLAAESFDAITLVLAIQNMTPLSPVWQACRGLLKPGGALIVVMMHPCFRIPRQSDWHWDLGTGTQVRLVRQYLSSSQISIQTHPGLAAHGKEGGATVHFHRPLQAYINTLGNAGLLIDHIEEWISHKKSQTGPRQMALDQARKEIPMFLALRARRV
jgi:SAM-dependent methyltransferase